MLSSQVLRSGTGSYAMRIIKIIIVNITFERLLMKAID